MIKIVHFGKYCFPHSGGIETVTACLAKGAAMAGYDVEIVCFEKCPVNKPELDYGIKMRNSAFKMLIDSQPLSLRYFLQCIAAGRQADLVHLHTPNMLAALCSFFLPARVKLLVHWHSDVLNKGVLGKFLRSFEFFVLNRAKSIVVTSQVYADASKSLSRFKEKITVVPIGVPDVKNGYSDLALPSSLESQIDNRKIVLAVGRLVPYKGFDVLISAANKLSKDSAVVIVGDGKLLKVLQENVRHLDLEDKVILAGRVGDAVLHSLFKRAALYCLPSTYRAEAFGVVLIEAMSYSLPLVTSKIPGSGVTWVNQHGITGLSVPVGDASAFASAINNILDSDELRNKFSKNSRKRYLDEFTEEKSINQLLKVYERSLLT